MLTSNRFTTVVTRATADRLARAQQNNPPIGRVVMGDYSRQGIGISTTSAPFRVRMVQTFSSSST